MERPIPVALIGLDTSHTLAFARLMHAPDVPQDQQVRGLRAVACLRFETPFQDRAGLDRRQAEMEKLGVYVTGSLDEAVESCEAILLEINDPTLHREYFARVAPLGKPVFIDKPLAGSLADARAIRDIARRHGVAVASSSSLRFTRALEGALADVPRPELAGFFGPINQAPAADSLFWYGVHTFEMLQRAMGPGASRVTAMETPTGCVSVVAYPDDRQATADLSRLCKHYGGRLQAQDAARPFVADAKYLYADQLRQVERFFRGQPAGMSLEDAVEVTALMDATRRALSAGAPVAVVES